MYRKSPMEISIVNPCRHRCKSLSSILNSYGLENVASYTTSMEFLDSIDSELQVCLMDVTMTDIDGFDLMKIITRNHPNVRVLVVTEHTHNFTIHWMIKYGTKGFISLHAPDEEIIMAIQDVMRGYHFNKYAPLQLFDDIKKRKIIIKKIYGRQKELLRYFAQGLSDKQIERRMGITYKTIQDYSERLSKKIDTGGNRSRRALFVSFAIKAGLAVL